jgi:hypothetical protein
MSLDEIIEELPKLPHAERRELSLRLLELEADEDVLLCSLAAAEAVSLLDRMEAEDQAANAKKRKTRRNLAD